jgi:membrane fusion protein, multidrug efflux system
LLSGEATHLATIQQLDPIYSDFTQSVSERRQLHRDLESGVIGQVSPDLAKVRLVLEDGTGYPLCGPEAFLRRKRGPDNRSRWAENSKIQSKSFCVGFH